MKITGKITQVMPLQEGTNGRGTQWKRQSFVVREDDANVAFPNEVVFDLWNDRIGETALAEGQHVDVHFGIRTREYNGRLFNDVNVLRVKGPSQSLPVGEGEVKGGKLMIND